MGLHIFDTMGTTVSLNVAGALPNASTLAEVEEAFVDIDRRFSLYRDDSELSRIARGELPLTRADAEVRQSYADALDWARLTGDAFTPHRPDGVIDLSGLVKATAIDRAGRVLEAAGEVNWLINAGGDILLSGESNVGGSREPWRLAIIDPQDRQGLLCLLDVTGSRSALATSGTAERGEHVWRASGDHRRDGHRPDERLPFVQVSVLADDIVTADVLATAILAGGPERSDDVLDRFDVDVLTVDGRGELTASPGFRRAAGLLTA
ncbi:FAD:protein FMN transferase [Agreia bicolorata]|nr:FAD:protein FMN transferase [Agreia bicolorata]